MEALGANPSPAGRFCIGIDDTDNPQTRGTGFRARQLVERLAELGLATGVGVTRHQLLVDPRIPYTSHNSSACIVVDPVAGVMRDDIAQACREFLLEIAAEGSDVGLCVALAEQAARVTSFGQRAKVEVLTQPDAEAVATALGILLEGLTGDHQGIIGALSAVGLHAGGNDGRYLWLAGGMREHADRIVELDFIVTRLGVERVVTIAGESLSDPAIEIHLGPWPRPVRIDGQAVLLVERSNGNDHYQVAAKDVIKSIRP